MFIPMVSLSLGFLKGLSRDMDLKAIFEVFLRGISILDFSFTGINLLRMDGNFPPFFHCFSFEPVFSLNLMILCKGKENFT